MNRHTVPRYGYAAEYRRRHDAGSRPDQSERDSPLAPGVALLIVVLSSLGLFVRYLVGGFLISFGAA